jgi:hypothetical protein
LQCIVRFGVVPDILAVTNRSGTSQRHDVRRPRKPTRRITLVSIEILPVDLDIQVGDRTVQHMLPWCTRLF